MCAKRLITEQPVTIPTKIYAGPTLHRRVLIGSSIYRNGIPQHVEALIERVPEIGQMIVPVTEYPDFRRDIREEGTEPHRLYNYLLTVRFDGLEVRN